MNMNTKISTLAVAVALGLGVASSASAGIYGGSSLLIDDLFISFTPTLPGSDPVIGQFDFSTTSTASLVPGGGDASLSLCSGNVTGGTTSCGGGGAGTPVLYTGLGGAGITIVGTGPADVGGGRTPLSAQPLNTAAFLGPNGTTPPNNVNYASGDAIIDSSELVDAINGISNGGTAARQIAETEISSATQGAANTNISSTTNFTYLFSLGGPGSISFSFLADPDLLAQFDDLGASGATAQAATTLSFRLSGTSGFLWSPTQITGGGCTGNVSQVFGSATCTSETVTENLNNTVNAPGPLPFSTSQYSRLAGDIGLGSYSLTMAGLTAGSYALTLNAGTSANATRSAAIPEPASLLLLGGGLTLMGVIRRRKLFAA